MDMYLVSLHGVHGFWWGECFPDSGKQQHVVEMFYRQFLLQFNKAVEKKETHIKDEPIW